MYAIRSYYVFTRPVTFAMFVFIIVTTALPFIRSRRRRRAQREAIAVV